MYVRMGTFAEIGRPDADLRPNELEHDDPQLVEAARARAARRLARRDLNATFALGLLFVGAALATFYSLPTHRSFSFATAALLVAGYALARGVEFEAGTGGALPTQLVLVPMFFLVPVRAVPLLVAAGALLRDVPRAATGRIPLERVFLAFGSSWYALGPALVLGLTGEPGPRWRHAALFAGALGAQFALDYASAAAREWFGLGVQPHVLLRFMRWSYLVDAALAPLGFALALASEQARYAFLLGLPLCGLIALFARERTARIDHALELSRAYRGTALLLGEIVEADDAYTGDHSRDVVELVVQVADGLGLGPRDRRTAELVALLHDVGKVRIPGEIINKPGGLTEEERKIINTHTVLGERMLERVGGQLGTVGRLVRSCHEHWDGQGYPDGLVGDKIPLVARIVCCCDAYSAMTTDRPYRPAALALTDAVAELKRCSGTQFDPAVVDALVRVVSS